MRTRLILGVIAAVMLVPQAALAQCVTRPFARVVESSDAVIVGTVADASPMSQRSGIVVRLHVEDVLKGAIDSGQRVWISSCSPVFGGPDAKELARQMVGTRALFLLSSHGPNFYETNVITTPQGMTLDNKIATAREVLGIQGVPFDKAHNPWWIQPSVWITLGVILLVTGAALAVRRARRV